MSTAIILPLSIEGEMTTGSLIDEMRVFRCKHSHDACRFLESAWPGDRMVSIQTTPTAISFTAIRWVNTIFTGQETRHTAIAN